MKSMNQYIIEKLKITKSANNKNTIEYKLYKEMCNSLYLNDIDFDGLCIVLENKRSHATSIYALFDNITYNNYRELMEDIYTTYNMVKSKLFHLVPIKNDNPLTKYIIFSSEWIDTEKEFYRDYFEKLFFNEY